MRLKQFLVAEAIQNPPHLPYQFFKSYIAGFEKISQHFVNFLQNDNYEWLRDIVGGSNRNTLEAAIDVIKWYAKTYIDRNPIDILKSLIDGNENDPSRLKTMLKYTLTPLVKLEEIAGHLPDSQQVLSAIEELNFQLDDNKNYMGMDGLPTYEIAKSQADQLKTVFMLMPKIFKMTEDFKLSVQAMLERVDIDELKYYNNQTKLPTHENVETLYHATTNVSAILREGFKTRDELGKAALGGGPSDLISFTSDLRIAEAVVWALRQAIRIAQGKLGYNALVRIIAHYGVDFADVAQYVNSAHGDFNVRRQSGLTEFSPSGQRQSTLDEQKEWLFQAFRLFLMKQNRIYDPLFAFVNVNDLATHNINDVGIIAGDVDMSKVQYLRSMEEYRVPVDAISNIRQTKYRGINFPVLNI